MLRKKREVTAPDEITDIIRRSTTLRVGFYGEESPYVVPVSFGFEIRDGKPVFISTGRRSAANWTCSERTTGSALSRISSWASRPRSGE